jgi:hypothetical protein
MKNLKELLAFVLSLGASVGKALEDKKIDSSDILHLIHPLTLAGPAFMDLGRLKAELAGAQPEDIKDLGDWAAQEFDIPQEEIEALIDEYLRMVPALASVVAKTIEFAKKPKEEE